MRGLLPKAVTDEDLHLLSSKLGDTNSRVHQRGVMR